MGFFFCWLVLIPFFLPRAYDHIRFLPLPAPHTTDNQSIPAGWYDFQILDTSVNQESNQLHDPSVSASDHVSLPLFVFYRGGLA